MDNDIKEAIAQRIAERVEGKNMSQEQVETLTAKVMERANEIAPAPPAPAPKFAEGMFKPFSLGSTMNGNQLDNARPGADYNKTWENRLNQKTYTPEQLQAEITPKKG